MLEPTLKLERPPITHTRAKARMDLVYEELINGNRVVGCYYKNQGIIVPLDVWTDTLKKRMSKDLTDKRLVEQTDKLHDYIAYKASDHCYKVENNETDVSLSIVYIANIAELLKRKLIPDDDENGFILMKARK